MYFLICCNKQYLVYEKDNSCCYIVLTLELVKKLAGNNAVFDGGLNERRVVFNHLLDATEVIVELHPVTGVVQMRSSDVRRCPLQGMDVVLHLVMLSFVQRLPNLIHDLHQRRFFKHHHQAEVALDSESEGAYCGVHIDRLLNTHFRDLDLALLPELIFVLAQANFLALVHFTK